MIDRNACIAPGLELIHRNKKATLWSLFLFAAASQLFT
jgi:hypothetical protein